MKALCLPLLLAAAAPLCAGDAREASAIRISEPVKLDGVLNDRVWRENPGIGDFVQAEPRSGNLQRRPLRSGWPIPRTPST